MAEETHYTANMGIVVISTANPNLNGTGTLGTLITGALNGTIIKTIRIKAQGSTDKGMIRLFQYGHSVGRLIKEIPVQAIVQAGTNPTFQITVKLDLFIESGDVLKVSTENADIFNVIAEGLDVSYYSPTVRSDATVITPNNNWNAISTANANLDGTGTMSNIFGWFGAGYELKMLSLTIKARVATTAGMIRLFVYNGSTAYLFYEIPVPASSPGAITPSFSENLQFEGGISLPDTAGFAIYASTQNAEDFSLSAEGYGWNYLA